nr:hypothetical protein [Micromonospora sp. DSM 115978]
MSAPATPGRRDLPITSPPATEADREADREGRVLDRIDAARRRRPKLREQRITSSHGAGGKASATLVDAVFLEAFRNPWLEQLSDSAVFTAAAEPGGGETRLAMTTDSYVVPPM